MRRIFSVTVMVAILASMSVVSTMNMMPEAEAFQKSSGNYNHKYGSDTKRIVCGDQLCSEVGMKKDSSHDMASKSGPSHQQMTVGQVSVESIIGATLKDAKVDRHSGTVTLSINSQDDGKIKVNLPSAIKDAFMVIVDGEEWDDAYVDGNKVKIYFYAGTEKIEIIGNTLG